MDVVTADSIEVLPSRISRNIRRTSGNIKENSENIQLETKSQEGKTITTHCEVATTKESNKIDKQRTNRHNRVCTERQVHG